MQPAPERGDVITAGFLRELADARDKIARLMKAVGGQGFNTSSVLGATVLPPHELAYVVMIRDAYTVDDSRFADPAFDPDGEENAAEMEYDAGEGDYVELTGGGRKILVVAAGGVVPKEGDQLWVRFSARDKVWTPLVKAPDCSAWIRIPPGSTPDALGWVLAYEDAWDENAQEWVQVREVYVRDANT